MILAMWHSLVTFLAQTTTTAVDATATSRNNAALPAAVFAMAVLGAFALSAPKWARRINARKAAR